MLKCHTLAAKHCNNNNNVFKNGMHDCLLDGFETKKSRNYPPSPFLHTISNSSFLQKNSAESSYPVLFGQKS